jgi:hypothetical protein
VLCVLFEAWKERGERIKEGLAEKVDEADLTLGLRLLFRRVEDHDGDGQLEFGLYLGLNAPFFEQGGRPSFGNMMRAGLPDMFEFTLLEA